MLRDVFVLYLMADMQPHGRQGRGASRLFPATARSMSMGNVVAITSATLACCSCLIEANSDSRVQLSNIYSGIRGHYRSGKPAVT